MCRSTVARLTIILIQVVKVFVPRNWSHSKMLHDLLAWGLKRFVSPEANWLILRHFHLGSQVLSFIGRNSPAPVGTSPLEPADIDALRDEMFLKHDLNLFNFVIRLNQTLRDKGMVLGKAPNVDFSMIKDPGLRLSDMPQGKLNFLDLQSAIELFTPLYQLMLTDNDFWRAANSLQLDETIGIYAATLLDAPDLLLVLRDFGFVSIKNKTPALEPRPEIAGTHSAHVRDGAAVATLLGSPRPRKPRRSFGA